MIYEVVYYDVLEDRLAIHNEMLGETPRSQIMTTFGEDVVYHVVLIGEL